MLSLCKELGLTHIFGRFPGEGRDPSFHQLELFTYYQ